jgi:hypothetical protein
VVEDILHFSTACLHIPAAWLLLSFCLALLAGGLMPHSLLLFFAWQGGWLLPSLPSSCSPVRLARRLAAAIAAFIVLPCSTQGDPKPLLQCCCARADAAAACGPLYSIFRI